MAPVLDLTSNVEATTALIAEPLAWRVRVVEQIDVDSPDSVRRRRSLQAAPVRPLLSSAGVVADTASEPGETALLVLPVAPVPKGPLLEFDVRGPGDSEAFLLQRADIAAREAAFLTAQAAEAGFTAPPLAALVIEAALGFTEAQWQRYRPDLAGYLAAGSGVASDSPHVLQWVSVSREVASLLLSFAEGSSPGDSAVETPALVVPVLLESGLLTSPDQATDALMQYASYVAEIGEVAGHPGPRSSAAETFLASLTDYGYNYDLLAVVRIPLDEPFLVKVADRRRLTLSRFANRGTQAVVIADARSNHVALRVSDPNARLAHVSALNASGHSAYGTFSYTETPQVHAAYAFERDRDYRITLQFNVAALRRLQLVPYALGVLLFALAVIALRTDPGPRELALLVGPGSLAASVLLAREPSALGSRLRRLSSLLVVVGMAFLILVAAWKYITLMFVTPPS